MLTEHGVPIAPRTFHAWAKRAPSKRALWDATITEILAGYYEPDEYGRRKPESLYGSLKMWAHLQREGIPVAKIGSRIAERLASRFAVVGFDPTVDAATLTGVRSAGSIAELACAADLVCLSLPNGSVSTRVVDELVGASPRRVTLVVELSTVGDIAAAEAAETARVAGVSFVDCPVSGGVDGAAKGTLAGMLAGERADVERARAVVDTLCAHTSYLGERVGNGQLAKLVNNVISATSIAVTSEAIAFAVSRGLDMAAVLDVVNSSTGQSQASKVKFPATVLTGTYAIGARGAVMAKDVALYAEVFTGCRCRVSHYAAHSAVVARVRRRLPQRRHDAHLPIHRTSAPAGNKV